MAGVDGVYDCVSKTPLGEQKMTLTVVSNGNSFQGTMAGPAGAIDVSDGEVDGNRLTWKMKMVVPMPMTLSAEAVVDGDMLNASVDTGAFGKFPMTGVRRG